MDETNMVEVRFDIFCKKCKHGPLNEVKDPCNECLEYGMREGTKKPFKFEEKK